jgi:hypothetical protein
LPCFKNVIIATCFLSGCYNTNVCCQNVNNSEITLSFQRKKFSLIRARRGFSVKDTTWTPKNRCRVAA